MHRIKKRCKISIFILFTLKKTKIKDLAEIKKHINETFFSILANAQLLNSNCLKLPSKISPLN